jgi:hypothetical protein
MITRNDAQKCREPRAARAQHKAFRRETEHVPQGRQPWSLEVVALYDILLHEEYNAARAEPLAQAMARDGMQRHPVIIARDLHGVLLHLDGANRITALQQLGCSHIAAQVLDYADPSAVQVDTWLHLTSLCHDEFLATAAQWHTCRVEPCTPLHALAQVTRGQSVAGIVWSHGEAATLHSSRGLADRVAAMRQLVALYENPLQRETLPATGMLSGVQALLSHMPQAKAAIAFAPMSKAEVMTLTLLMGLRLPAGITRHLITCGRLLHVNAPLSLLRSELSADEKTAWLQAHLAKQCRRFYAEPTIAYEAS